MEHLKAAFHDELADPHIENVRVSDGLVHIREWNWPPHEVLISMGKAAYDQAFKNWREERREALLAKAEEVLISYDQADRFALLKESYRRGLVMPFVGAGMSMPSGYISWTTFLNRLWTDAGLDEARLNTMLDAGQYEQAAQVAADTLGFGFNERVAARYSLDKELKGAVQYLPYVFPKASVVTTNFDSVVKRCFRACEEAPFEDELVGLDADELPRYLAGGRRILVKLHGSASTARGRVLTTSEYENAYADLDKLPRAIGALCSRTLLFLGCRLTVDRVLAALQTHVATQGHERVAKHYAFLAAPQVAADRRVKERMLERLNIYPIWYPANEDDESIEAYFYRLAEGVTPL